MLGTRLYMKLNTQTNEMEEIANNNIAVAIVVSAITVTLALMLADGMQVLLQSMVPAPASLNENFPF